MNKEQIKRLKQARDIAETLNVRVCPRLRQIVANLNIVLKENK